MEVEGGADGVGEADGASDVVVVVVDVSPEELVDVDDVLDPPDIGEVDVSEAGVPLSARQRCVCDESGRRWASPDCR